MDYGSYSHRPSRELAYICCDEPLIVKFALQTLLQSTNVGPGGDQVTQEKDIRPMPQNHLYYFLQRAHQMPAADVKVTNGEWAGPCIHAELAGEMFFCSTLNQKGSPI
jgi:hypothetical protein